MAPLFRVPLYPKVGLRSALSKWVSALPSDATGGIAIAIGDDLVLWKAPEAPAVQSGTHHSTEPVRVIRSVR